MELESPLKRGITQCRHEAKRWLAMVVFTLATLVIAICINAMWPSLELQQAVNLLAAASVMAIICSLFGVKQCLNSNESIQYGLSAFRDLRRSLEDVESEKADLREALQQFRSSYLMLLLDFESVVCDEAKLQKELDATKQRLEDTRDELVSAGYAIESIRNGFCQAKKNAEALQDSLDATEDKLEQVKDRLCETDDALVQTRDQLREVKHQRDGLQSERDDLQNKLNTARRISVRRLIERNELQDQNDGLRKELHEAKMDLEWSRGLHADAKALIAGLKRQITDLKKARSERDELQGRNNNLCKELNESTEKVDWLRRKYFEVWRKTLRQSYNAKRQVTSLEDILKNLDEATEIADLREKLKMVINRLSSEDSRE